MSIDTKHPEYFKYIEKWRKVRDCVDGQDKIKEKGEEYLPRLGGQKDNRYKKYKDRASFIDFTGRALNVAVGQIFRKSPMKGDLSEEVIDNIDLKGTDFDYFWRQVSSEIITVDRVGILVDYQEKQKRSYLTMYKAESIINWKTEVINGVEKLSLVILEGEVFKDDTDKYGHDKEKRWKVLELEEGVYTVSTWRKKIIENTTVWEQVGDFIKPIKNNQFMIEIPFYFVTSNSITWELRNAPLLPMANLNLGHYKNYADYENMLHFTGVPTIIAKGRNKNNESFPVGGVVDFDNTDGSAEYMQASSDSGLKEELKNKVEMMAILSNAFLAGSGRYVASAETARITTQGEHATLADISNALTVSVKQILALLIEWQTGKEYIPKIKFNTDFETSEINPQLLTTLMAALGSSNMSFETFYYNLKNKEMYPENWTIDDEKEAIESDKEKKVEERENAIGEQFNVQPESESDMEVDKGRV